jgi:chaperonin GroEL
VIYVGGETDMEQKELYDRVDDAVCAVRSALSEGVLPGGGVALMYVAEEMKKKHNGPAFDAFYSAIRAPYETIQKNAGVSHTYNPKTPMEGLNIRTMEKGNMVDMGVIDPTKVTKNALISATSVAATLLGTNVTIHESDK